MSMKLMDNTRSAGPLMVPNMDPVMEHSTSEIMNPLGRVNFVVPVTRATARTHGTRRVVGLLDNGKPNVSIFLSAIETDLQPHGCYEVVSVTKPRSAAPSPDVTLLSEQCDFVINAVAD